MSYLIDGPNLRRNEVTCFGTNNGPSYNAVLSVSKSDEDISSPSSVTEPVTLQEAKNWCRIDITDDDAIVTELITASIIICEEYVNLSFIERSVTAKIHNGAGNITLPYGPVNGIISFTDIDSVALDSTYKIRTPNEDDIIATYNAGYATLPRNLKTALLNQIAWSYENRGDAKLANGLSENAKLILYPLRILS